MGKTAHKPSDGSLSRRSFLEASALSVAALGLAGCGNDENTLEEVEPSDAPSLRIDADVDPNIEGEWIPAWCGHNCGGRCANYAYVVDGIVTRQKTDDTHEDTYEAPQHRSCVRGRSQRRHFLGPDRLKYPMKRVHWEPITGGRKELRGIDEWERISWDEAIDLITAELRHIVDTYGSSAILCTSGANPVSSMLGGALCQWSTGSEGIFRFSPEKFYGFTKYGNCEGSDRMDMMNVEHLVFYASNPAWASGGMVSHQLDFMRENGTKFYSVGPFKDATACAFGAEWIPVRVGTDCAFLAAVAYVMLEEDDPDTNPIIDWDYLERCTVGFDDDHMPESPSIKENFKGYVLGEYDGVPKTPEWATEICGTPVEKIREYARLMAKDNKVYIGFSMSAARQAGAESYPQMLMTIAAMGGHFGKSGHGCSSLYYAIGCNDGPNIVQGSPASATSIQSVDAGVINATKMWDAVVTGKYVSNGAGPNARTWEPGVETDCDIHMIWAVSNSHLATTSNTTRGIEAFRKVDFVLNQSWLYRAEAQFADIVLPISTPWEGDDGLPVMGAYGGLRARDFLFFPRKITEPLYESHTDRWVYERLLEALGHDASEAYSKTNEQAVYESIASAQILDGKTGEYKPLLTITAEDIEGLGAEGEPQQGVVDYQYVRQNGFYPIERKAGDDYEYIGFQAFYEDPENCPRPSTSGKMEIFSDTYANLINNMGFHPDMRIKPYPTYIPFDGNYSYTFENQDISSGKKAKYPIQVFNPHYLRSSHATLGNVDWLQEAWTQPAFVAAADAAERGVKSGDTILIHNENGKVLRKACVTELLVPGTLALPHGGWIDWDEENGICRGGSENILTHITSVSGVNAFNTSLVDYEVYDGVELEDDCLKPRRIVSAQEA